MKKMAAPLNSIFVVNFTKDNNARLLLEKLLFKVLMELA